jgi:hypothetical protein
MAENHPAERVPSTLLSADWLRKYVVATDATGRICRYGGYTEYVPSAGH